MRRRNLFAVVAAIALTGVGASPTPAQERSISVFAAASMKNALDHANAAFMQATGIKVSASYAATSALVRQIEQGAPADVLVSADLQWMEYAVGKKLVQQPRIDLLGNRLVLIAPAGAAIGEVNLASAFDLAALAGNGRIVTGDVRAVPAGRYAKAALESLGLWKSVEPKLAMVENVRAALALVARGEAPLGIVYATDALIEPQVKVVGTFPASAHPPIVYPAAATVSPKPAAASYLAFLRSSAARAIFERHGFTFLALPSRS